MSNTARIANIVRLHASGIVIAAALCGFSGQAMAQEAPSASPKSDDIIVTAQRVNATHVENGGGAGVLGNKSALDLPFNLRSYDETLILNQQPKSLGEVLENDPTIRTSYGYGNASENFIIRGFPLYGDDVGLNGLYGIAPRQLTAPELFESVQVLNGASAFVNGASPGGSGLGGSVNLLLKRAGSEPLNRVTVGYTSDSHFGGSFDVGRRYGDFGVRINGNYQDGDVAINREDRMTQVLGVGLDWSHGPVRVSLDLGYQKVGVDSLRPKLNLYTAEIPKVPKASANYAQDYTYTRMRDFFGVFNFEYDFAPNATLWAKAGARDGKERGIYGTVNVTDALTGDGYGTAASTPLNQNNEAAEIGARVKLGSVVTNEISWGANINWQEFRTAYDFFWGPDFAGKPTNIYNTPQTTLPASSFSGGDLDDPFPITRNKLWSVFAADTIGFWDDRVMVTGGLRLQSLDVKSYAYTDAFDGSYAAGDLTSEYKRDAITPVVGIVVKPAEKISLYANRIEALQQGSTAGSDAVNFGEVLAPYVSTQYEFGGKVQVGPMFAGLSFYQIKKPNAFTDPVTLIYGLHGQQRNRGVEFTLNGEIVHGLRLISGVAVTDAKLTKTSDGTDGNIAKGVPDWTANANLEWDTPFITGLTLTGRVTYTGKQWVDNANTMRLPDWAVFNLGARFVTAAGDVPVTLRLSVDNVANKAYWSSAYDSFGTALLQGQPRTFKASISADF
ncbi:TonB-dependent receptor [Novosphingobium sp. BL-8H]|uniref:TonB-dependent receptor n=1 Tax=Novosphingobium sp. BL-8H TaxID=3127640 RepID=UPI003757BC8C